MTAYASKSGRLENLLSLKGLACILVVVHHAAGIHPEMAVGPVYRQIWQISDALSHLRMPLFAFIAGYVFSMRPLAVEAYWPFMRKKLTRLYVPSVVLGMLYLLVSLLAPGVGSRHAYAELPGSLIYPVAQYWFIQALMFIFLVVGLAEILGLLSTPRRLGVVLLISIAVHQFGVSDIQVLSLGGAAYLLPFFVMGIGLHRYSPCIPWNGWCSAVVAGIFGITFLVHAAGVFGFHGVRLERNTLLALLLSTSSILVVCRLFPSVPQLDYFGRHSFAIFLFHMFFTSAMRRIGDVAGMEQDVMLFAATLFAGIAGSILVERLVRKAPVPFASFLPDSSTVRRPEPEIPSTYRAGMT